MSYSITTKDGIRINNIPDDIRPDDPSLKARVNRIRAETAVANDPITQGAREFANEMTVGQQLAAGVGKTFADYYQGAKQRMGFATEQDVAAKRALDAPLMRTTAGATGAFAGHFVPALVPGGQTLAGAAAIGGGMGLFQPTAEGESPLVNTALGVSGGMAGKVLGDKVAAFVRRPPQSMLTPQQTRAVESARQMGLAVPPSQAGAGTTGRMLEGFSGKIQTAQVMSAKNQEVFQSIVRRELNLPENTQITPEILEGLRRQAGQAYEAVKSVPQSFVPDEVFVQNIQRLGGDYVAAAREFPDLVKNDAIQNLMMSLLGKNEMSPPAVVELIKKLRFDASKNLKAFDNPEKAALGRAQKQAANALEGLAERNLAATNPQLVPAFREARTMIAKTYEVEDALNQVTGTIKAQELAKKSDKLTGGLKQIAQFAQAFPKASQVPERMGGLPGVSPLDYAAIAMTAGAAQRPEIMGAIFGRPMVRSLIASDPYQRMFIGQGPGLLHRASPALPYMQRAMPALGATGLLNYAP